VVLVDTTSVALLGNKKLFHLTRHIFGEGLEEMYIRNRTCLIIDKKISSLQSYERKFNITLEAETRKRLRHTRQIFRLMNFQLAK
jgi:hypothetical protein